jgi:hypothetical protein
VVSPFGRSNRLDPGIDLSGGSIGRGEDDAAVAVGYGHWVPRLLRLGPRLLDLAVVAVGVWQQAEIWSAHGAYRPVVALAALATVACLLARERTPLASRVGVFVALGVWAGFLSHRAGTPPSLFFTAVLGFWVAGLAPERNQALLGAAAGVLLVAYQESVFPGGSAGDFVLTTAFVFAFWTGAYVLAQRARHERLLASQLARLGVEREQRARRAVAEERVRIASAWP